MISAEKRKEIIAMSFGELRRYIAEIAQIEEENVPVHLVSAQFAVAWTDWINFRRNVYREIPNTQSTIAQLQMLSFFDDPIMSITQSIRNRWKGLFQPQAEKHKFVQSGIKVHTSRQERNRDTVPLFVPVV